MVVFDEGIEIDKKKEEEQMVMEEIKKMKLQKK